MTNWRSIAKCESDLRNHGRKAENRVKSILPKIQESANALNAAVREARFGAPEAQSFIDEFESRVAWWVMSLVDADVSRFIAHSEGDDIPEIAADRFGMVEPEAAKGELNSLDNLMSADELLQGLNTDEACKFIDDAVERLNELAMKSPTYRAMIKDKLDV